MPWIAAAIAAVGVGGAIGSAQAKKNGEQEAGDAMKNAYAAAQARIDAVGAPPDLSAKIALDEFRKAGVLTPQLEQAINAGASKEAQIQEDPAMRNAQTNALSQLSQLGRTGLNATDRAALQQIQDQIQQQNTGNQQSIIQNMAQRGQAGGGAEIAARMAGGQNAANAQSNASMQVAGQAQQRALQAMAQSGQLGGQIRGQDFSVNQAKAQAADQMNRFNTTNQIAAQQRNVGANNQAQYANLQNAQTLSNMNTATANTEAQRQEQAKRQYWLDKLNYAQAQNDPTLGYGGATAKEASQMGDTQSQMWTGISQGVMGGLSSFMGGGAGGAGGAAGGNANNAPKKAPMEQAPSY